MKVLKLANDQQLVKRLQLAKTNYHYVPDVLCLGNQGLAVTVITGCYLDTYLAVTKDKRVLTRLRAAFRQLRQTSYHGLYLTYGSYQPQDFVVDRQGQVWLTNWTASQLVTRDQLLTEDLALEDLLVQLTTE